MVGLRIRQGQKWLRLAMICSVALLAASSALVQAVEPATLRVYLGTYTNGKSQGIYVSSLDLKTGQLSKPVLAAEAKNPSFLAIDPTGQFVVAVNEISDLDGKPVGGVSSFAIEADSGKLQALSQQPSGGAGPCHVSFDRTGKFVLAANYGGGSCCVLPIDSDGKLGAMTGFQQHTGQGAVLPRQKDPHAHSINVSPDNRFAFCADLGLDKILIYNLTKEGKLEPNDPAFAKTQPGGGPRHFAFHPTGKLAFSNLEITSSVTSFAYDAEKGTLTEVQTISTLPEPTPGNSTAETQVHPNGKFLYVSNRGHNSIAVFEIAEDGHLKAVGHQGKGISIPRNFAIDPTGQFALVANQSGDSVLVFAINQQTGMLEPTDHRIDVPAPVCVKMMAVK